MLYRKYSVEEIVESYLVVSIVLEKNTYQKIVSSILSALSALNLILLENSGVDVNSVVETKSAAEEDTVHTETVDLKP